MDEDHRELVRRLFAAATALSETAGAMARRSDDDRGRLSQSGKIPGGRQKPSSRIGVVPRDKRARLTRNCGLLREPAPIPPPESTGLHRQSKHGLVVT